MKSASIVKTRKQEFRGFLKICQESCEAASFYFKLMTFADCVVVLLHGTDLNEVLSWESLSANSCSQRTLNGAKIILLLVIILICLKPPTTELNWLNYEVKHLTLCTVCLCALIALCLNIGSPKITWKCVNNVGFFIIKERGEKTIICINFPLSIRWERLFSQLYK